MVKTLLYNFIKSLMIYDILFYREREREKNICYIHTISFLRENVQIIQKAL